MGIKLDPHQLKAIEELDSGSVLRGGVGSGKSRTALAYYYLKEGLGGLVINDKGTTKPMQKPKDLYIITTAKKRDSLDWEDEMLPFILKKDKILITVDSWNNVKKYIDVRNAFFIFDEQRAIGSGTWSKSFIKIAKKNRWILLSATPGDVWMDYVPIFVANGFYKNRSEFIREHVVYSRYAKYPKIDKYVNPGKLIKLRKQITVMMPFSRKTIPINKTIKVDYDEEDFKTVFKRRWNIYKDKPIKETSELFHTMRKVTNSDPSRLRAVKALIKKHNKVIIFYNFNYELDTLRTLSKDKSLEVAEWNGQKHEMVPTSTRWVYLVQYTAGAEGWNCITTDTIIFYSLNYSYKITNQAAGRIDRMNTPFTELYYYKLVSDSEIDKAVASALSKKRNFHEKGFVIN